MRSLRYKIQLVSLAVLLLLVFVFKFNVEAYCPFGAIESIYTYFAEGRLLCALGTGNFFALISVIVLTLLFRRVFCGYICPIGAISAFMKTLSADLGIKQIKVPDGLDRWLNLIKYIIFISVLVLSGLTITLVWRDVSPCYVLVSINDDVKMSAYISAFIFLAGSLFIAMPFCRWVCPFAVVQNILSRFSPLRISRDATICVNCNKCSKACPMGIDVAAVDQVRSAACLSCFECQAVCPVKTPGGPEVLSWTFLGRFKISRPGRVLFISLLLAVCFTAAADRFIDIPTYIYHRDQVAPSGLQRDIITVQGVSCAGSAQLFIFFLNRDDMYEIPGYIRVAARPRQGWLDIAIDHGPDISVDELVEAITEPYFDEKELRWRPSPFDIKGVDQIF